MAVDARQGFFAAHFFQDPVQPGSLGLEAMLDALRAAARLCAGPSAQGARFREGDEVLYDVMYDILLRHEG
jgi:3-hydroxymyristoyl/3-hydroxydecanoyl-(acyl carrier protein) dehydratase